MKKIIRITIILFLSVCFSAPAIFARDKKAKTDLVNDFISYLTHRTPTPAEDMSQDNISLELAEEGQRPNLYGVPRLTAWTFEEYLFKQEKFDELAIFCDAVIKASPDFFTYYVSAQALEILGETDLAVERYKKSIEVLPRASLPYFRLWGIYLYDKKDKAKAEEYLNKYNQSLAKEQSVYNTKKTIMEGVFAAGNYFLNKTREFDKAGKYFHMALKLKPNFERAKLNLSISKLNKSMVSKSREDFEKAVDEIKTMIQMAQENDVASFAKDMLEQSKKMRKETFGE